MNMKWIVMHMLTHLELALFFNLWITGLADFKFMALLKSKLICGAFSITLNGIGPVWFSLL